MVAPVILRKTDLVYSVETQSLLLSTSAQPSLVDSIVIESVTPDGIIVENQDKVGEAGSLALSQTKADVVFADKSPSQVLQLSRRSKDVARVAQFPDEIINESLAEALTDILPEVLNSFIAQVGSGSLTVRSAFYKWYTIEAFSSQLPGVRSDPDYELHRYCVTDHQHIKTLARRNLDVFGAGPESGLNQELLRVLVSSDYQAGADFVRKMYSAIARGVYVELPVELAPGLAGLKSEQSDFDLAQIASNRHGFVVLQVRKAWEETKSYGRTVPAKKKPTKVEFVRTGLNERGEVITTAQLTDEELVKLCQGFDYPFLLQISNKSNYGTCLLRSARFQSLALTAEELAKVKSGEIEVKLVFDQKSLGTSKLFEQLTQVLDSSTYSVLSNNEQILGLSALESDYKKLAALNVLSHLRTFDTLPNVLEGDRGPDEFMLALVDSQTSWGSVDSYLGRLNSLTNSVDPESIALGLDCHRASTMFGLLAIWNRYSSSRNVNGMVPNNIVGALPRIYEKLLHLQGSQPFGSEPSISNFVEMNWGLVLQAEFKLADSGLDPGSKKVLDLQRRCLHVLLGRWVNDSDLGSVSEKNFLSALGLYFAGVGFPELRGAGRLENAFRAVEVSWAGGVVDFSCLLDPGFVWPVSSDVVGFESELSGWCIQNDTHIALFEQDGVSWCQQVSGNVELISDSSDGLFCVDNVRIFGANPQHVAGSALVVQPGTNQSGGRARSDNLTLSLYPRDVIRHSRKP